MEIQKQNNELQEHIFSTYVNLRIGIAIIGILLPILLLVVGKSVGVGFQNSISAYFHAETDGFLLRSIFVGTLFAIGVALYLYKGYSGKENIALNLAGAFAVGVAVFPMTWRGTDGEVLYQGINLLNFGEYTLSLHGVCAVFMFLCIAYVCIWCASDTLHLLDDERKRKLYKRMYKFLGFGMILFPLAASVLAVVFHMSDKTIFIVESVGIITFAAYWWIKSREISLTSADRLALNGTLNF